MSTPVGAFFISPRDAYQTDRVRKTVQTVQQQLAQRETWQHDATQCIMCRYWLKVAQVFCPGYYAIEHGIDATAMVDEEALIEISKLIMLDKQADAKKWIEAKLNNRGMTLYD